MAALATTTGDTMTDIAHDTDDETPEPTEVLMKASRVTMQAEDGPQDVVKCEISRQGVTYAVNVAIEVIEQAEKPEEIYQKAYDLLIEAAENNQKQIKHREELKAAPSIIRPSARDRRLLS